jgi:FdhD protein
MRRGRAEPVFAVRRDASGARSRFEDHVIVEEPLEIRLDGTTVATTVRTPGHDFELAVGFCWGEGVLAGEVVRDVRYCEAGDPFDTGFNVVSVGTKSGRAGVSVQPRLTSVSAACGVCGSASIDELSARLATLAPPPELDPAIVRVVDENLRRAQPLFDATGAVHAAAAFDLSTGAVTVAREDIGRHNAVDKVVGRLVLDGALPASDLGLFVSGRASFEMVQKAWAAGFRWLVAVGGPSSLAVTTARAANLGLIAFARGATMTQYAPEDRP